MTETTGIEMGIDDTTNGHCEAHVNIKGEDFQCVQAIDHEGWPHRNPDAEVVW